MKILRVEINYKSERIVRFSSCKNG